LDLVEAVRDRLELVRRELDPEAQLFDVGPGDTDDEARLFAHRGTVFGRLGGEARRLLLAEDRERGAGPKRGAQRHRRDRRS
jgi:hypothetical protein